MRIFKQKILVAVFTAIITLALGYGQVAPVFAEENPVSTSVSTSSQLLAQTPPPSNTTTPQQDPATDPNQIGDTNTSIDAYKPEVTCENSFPGLGWLICQFSRGLYSIFEWLINDVIAANLLRIDLLDQEEALKSAWNGFRTVANIVFIIAFLIVIYAEAIGNFGQLEAYSFQRILPRLVLAVIGIQLSFFIVGYTIEFFNDIGDGAAQIVLAPVDGWSQFELGGLFSNATRGDSWFGIPVTGVGDGVDNIIAGIALIGGGAALVTAVCFLPLMLLFGVLGLLLLLFTLIARKLIIIALVVLAPLAFAAYALPNTESTFKLWWDTFWKTLAMYPIIMVFIASGQLLGRLAVSGDQTNFIDSVVGFIATFLPLFIIPATFKFAGSAIGAVVGGVSKFNDAIKGDPRNEGSLRNTLKSRGKRNANRMWNGEMRWKYPGLDTETKRPRMRTSSRSIMPMAARAVYGRTPGTSSSGQTIDDLNKGREMVDLYAKTMGDDFVRAMAVTGGGARRGINVPLKGGGTMNSGRLKFGKHLAYGADGNILTDSSGAALLADETGAPKRDIRGNLQTVGSGDFYDYEMMQGIKRYSTAFGTIHAAAEYTMGKGASKQDEAQVWSGLDAANYSKDEKSRAFNGTWAKNKGDKLHLKFGDAKGFFHDGSFETANDKARDMSYDFDKMSEYVYKKQRAYDVMQQGGEFWQVATEGFKSYDKYGVQRMDTSNMSEQQIKAVAERNKAIIQDKRYEEVVGMARKAQSIINSSRSIRSAAEQDGAENVQLMGSQATSHSADMAEKFLTEFYARFGKLPKQSDIERNIAP